MKYTFNNDYKPYIFSADGCWTRNEKIISYGDFSNFQLRQVTLIDNFKQSESIKGLKRLFYKPMQSRLIIKYQTYDYLPVKELDIIIEQKEIEDARELARFLGDLLKKYNDLKNQPSKEIARPNIAEQYVSRTEPVNSSTAIVRCSKVFVDDSIIPKIKKEFIAIDTETTGLSPVNDRIVELGAVRFVDGIKTDTFSSLVNAGKSIPPAASRVNHITNEMISNARTEEEVFAEFIKFLRNGVNGEVILCAHNASFDFGFLENTLKRLNINATFNYIDTLSLCRRKISGLKNYKQGTLEEFFGITNKESHRAESDAEACGWILLKTIDYKQSVRTTEQFQNNSMKKQTSSNKIKDNSVINQTVLNETEIKNMSSEELEICAVFYDILYEANLDASYLRFEKNTTDIRGLCYNMFISFNILKKGKYLIVPQSFIADKDVISEPCPYAEGLSYKRVFFQSPLEIKKYAKNIADEYYKSYCMIMEAKKESRKSFNTIRRNNEGYCRLNYTDVKRFMVDINQKDYSSVPLPSNEINIKREDVIINVVPERVPIENITELKDWDYETYPYKFFLDAEEKRKNKEYGSALELYERARESGLLDCDVYIGFSQLYHALKDYENEILILDEGIEKVNESAKRFLITRRDTAIKALYKKQEDDRIKIEKEEAKKRKQEERELSKNQSSSQKGQGRAIIQLDDDGNILAEYPSVTKASETVGVNTKSISDAAKGKQKHAGGFCWKYKDEINDISS